MAPSHRRQYLLNQLERQNARSHFDLRWGRGVEKKIHTDSDLIKMSIKLPMLNRIFDSLGFGLTSPRQWVMGGGGTLGNKIRRRT